MSRMASTLLFSLLIMLGISNPRAGLAQDASNQNQGLRMGFSAGIFADVNTTDARAAAKVWSEQVMRKHGVMGMPDTLIYDTPDGMMEALAHRELDMVTMLAKEYLGLNLKSTYSPRFVSLRRGRITESSLVLVHRLSGIDTLADLHSKSVILTSDARASMARVWLENLLAQGGFRSPDAFFGSVTNVTKYSRAVLPVFFKQADACLVPRAGFETMAELNPQLNRDLRILLESPAYISSVICLRHDYSQKEAVADALATLQDEASGQQLLTMFHIDKLVPYQDSYLDSAREALRQHALKAAGAASGTAK